MFFNKPNKSKLMLLISVLFLCACAAKQPAEQSDLQLQANSLQIQKETEQFKQALALIETENASEKDLLKAKEILDALYQQNGAYLGALINSADISLTLEKLDDAKKVFLEVLQKIENQNVESERATRPVSEHLTMFTLHTYNQLGLIERQLGQFDQAEAYYRQALGLSADNPVTIKNLAILLDLYKGKLAEALVLYEQYQGLLSEPDPKIKDWIFDLKNRLPEGISND